MTTFQMITQELPILITNTPTVIFSLLLLAIPFLLLLMVAILVLVLRKKPAAKNEMMAFNPHIYEEMNHNNFNNF